jgi:hypothetical protein
MNLKFLNVAFIWYFTCGNIFWSVFQNIFCDNLSIFQDDAM